MLMFSYSIIPLLIHHCYSLPFTIWMYYYVSMCVGLVGLVRRQHSGNQNSPEQGLGQEQQGSPSGSGPTHQGNYSPSYGSSRGGGDNGSGGGSSIFAGLGTNHHRRGLLSSIGNYTAIPLRYYPFFVLYLFNMIFFCSNNYLSFCYFSSIGQYNNKIILFISTYLLAFVNTTLTLLLLNLSIDMQYDGGHQPADKGYIDASSQ